MKIDELISSCKKILASGKHFRLAWVCCGCRAICIANVPDAVFRRGLHHEECGCTTSIEDKSVVPMIEQYPITIPRYEDLDPEIMKKVFDED